MSFAIFINYLDGVRKADSWLLDYTETYKAGDQITLKLDQHRGPGQIKLIIPEEQLEDFIKILNSFRVGVSGEEGEK